MADPGAPLSNLRPLLAFPPPVSGPSPKRRGFRPSVRTPSAGRQGERLTPQFHLLLEVLEHDRAQLVGSATAPDPELVAVFDLAGTVEEFLRAATGIEGLEFLADLEGDEVEADDDFYVADGKSSAKLVPQSLYMVMTNAQAVRELVRLFGLWQQDQSVKFDRGLGPLKRVFELLRSIRRWGPEDRVRETGILDRWREDVEIRVPPRPSRVEIELWYRQDDALRLAAQTQVTSIIRRLGGDVLTAADFPNIAYHGLLADIPSSSVQRVRDEGLQAIELLTTDAVMFVNPSPAMTFPASEPVLDGAIEFDHTIPAGSPRVALFDGVPMSNHVALASRLIIDDPDDHAAQYELKDRCHGSAMASLIAHGDLSTPGEALPQPIYVRPIFVPYSGFVPNSENRRDEVVPTDQLLVDLIHRAFLRVFEGAGDAGPAAPSVRIVCLALGDPARMFVRRLSPLAKLLDWLAVKYNIVIVVSGGNVDSQPTLDLAEASDGQRLLDLGAESDIRERQSAALRSLHDQAKHRRLLAPAEAVNVVSVGSVHADGLDFEPSDTVLDVMPPRLPAGYSPVGLGYRNSVKPEVLLPGGRQVFRAPPPGESGPAQLEPVQSPRRGPGLRAATPGRAGEIEAFGYSCGTSNSTALATRTLSQILDVLEGLQHNAEQFPFPDAQYHPVLAKTLLVHAAMWTDAGKERPDSSPGRHYRSTSTAVSMPGSCKHRSATRLQPRSK